jgi:multicomponent Na+:H+ antiporter subunit D
VFQGNLLGHDAQFAAFLMPLAVLAILVGSAVALFEVNIKRLLAYSSVAQIGYIVLGASLVSVSGLSAGLMHMFNHALSKGALFLAVMCLSTRFGRLDLQDLAGAARHMPWTLAALAVAGLSLIGVPGTAGFVSKWYLMTAALQAGTLGWVLVAVIVLGSLMAVVYVWRIVETAWFKDAPVGAGAVAPGEAPLEMLALTWLAALSNVWFGLVTQVPRELAATAATILLGHLP